jgi:hypothetical protein
MEDTMRPTQEETQFIFAMDLRRGDSFYKSPESCRWTVESVRTVTTTTFQVKATNPDGEQVTHEFGVVDYVWVVMP